MFVPLHDANSLKHIKLQYVTIALIAINVVALLFTAGGSDGVVRAAVFGLGYIPAVVNDFAELSPDLYLVPPEATYVTYAFLHGDIFHLGGNMLFLWVFGDNVEDALGHFRYLIFYLACAVAGAFCHGFFQPDSQEPLIGASGAVAGIVAAYLMLHPKVRLWVLAFGSIPLRIPAVLPLVLWVGLQFYNLAIGGDDKVSWAAHVGGIFAGMVLIILLKRRGVSLFDKAVVTPKAVVVEAETVDREAPKSPWGRQ